MVESYKKLILHDMESLKTECPPRFAKLSKFVFFTKRLTWSNKKKKIGLNVLSANAK